MLLVVLIVGTGIVVSPIRALAYAADGSGTLTTPTATVVNGSAGNTITFTYTAATGGTHSGALTLVVPSGWSAPSTTGSNAGYTTSTTGTVSVSGQTITVSGLTLSAGATLTLTYGSKASSGPGATAPNTDVGSQTWQAKEKSTNNGTLTSLASSPSITVLSGDGHGTMTADTANVANGATGETVTFTFTAAPGGTSNGSVTLQVPTGWSAPSTSGTSAGYTTSSAGTLTASSQTITVSSLTLASNATFTITYGSKAATGPGATATTTAGPATWTTKEQSSGSGTLTTIGASPSINVYAADGSGTLSSSVANVGNGSAGNTITFTYTAATGGIGNGGVSVAVPAGWSVPSVTGTDPGYATASAGSLSLSGQTITVSGVTLAANATFTITYGSKASSGPGATAPTTAGSATWTTQEESTAGGAMTAIGASPSINVYAADGTGTLTTNTANVANGSSGNTVVFTYTASTGGMSAGSLAVTVPGGWSAPSTTGSSAGYTTASTGAVSVAGQTITVSGVTLAANATLSITYGATSGGGSGATASTTAGPATWTVQEASTSGGTLTNLLSSPSINVYAADGSGTMTTTTGFVTQNSSGNTITFTYTAATGGISNGAVTLTVPAGWNAPSITGTDGGYTTASSGTLSVAGQVITVSGITLSANGTLTVIYGSKASSGPGATAPSTTGTQTWTAQEKSASGGSLTNLAGSPAISIVTPYMASVLSDSPSVYFRLGESGCCTAGDSSGNGVTGTYAGSGVTYSTAGAITNDTDTAVTSAGTGSVLSAADSTLPSGGADRTLEVWEKTSTSGWLTLGEYGSDYGAAVGSNGVVIAGANPANAPYSLEDGSWHLIDIAYSAGSLTYYADGQDIGSVSISARNTTLAGYQLSLGTYMSGVSTWFSGSLDEFAMYPSLLSASRIEAHWVAGVNEICPATPSSGYAGTVTADAPTRYYRFGETSGVYGKDYSGSCLPGAYNPGTQHVAGALSGDSDGAAASPTTLATLFNASATGLPTGDSDRTIEAWEKTTYSGWSTLFEYGGDFGMAVSPSGIIMTAANSVRAYSSYSLADGNWHQIAITYHAGSLTFYADGQDIAVGTIGARSTSLTGHPLAVGVSLSGISDWLSGSIDELAVYPSVLSASRIRAHWVAGTGEACPSTPSTGYSGVVAAASPSRYYRLGEASGTYAKDYSSSCAPGAYNPAAAHVGGALLTDSDGGVGTPASAAPIDASAEGLPDGNSDRTLEIWENTTYTGWSTLAVYGNDFGAALSSTGVLAAGVSGPITSPVSSAYSLTDGNWHQIAMTYHAGNLVFYVDGQEIGNVAISNRNTALNGYPLLLGESLSGVAGWFSGKLDEVAIYPTALSASQIFGHYVASGNAPPFIGGALTPAEAAAGGYNWCSVCHGWVRTGNATKRPVNTQSGEFWHDFTDISIPGRGYPLDVSRTYSSLNASVNGPFGYGWSANLGMSLAVTGTSPNEVATITQENGNVVTFNQPGSGSNWPASAPRFIATLTANADGTWTLVRQAKDTYKFNGSGQLISATDLNGYTTTYTYNGSGQLSSIGDEASRTLSFGWTGSNITSVTDSNVTGNTRTVSYSYDGSGNLASVTDVNGGVTDFAYDASHRMTLMRMPNFHGDGALSSGPASCTSAPTAHTTNNHYDANGRVDCQWDPNGNKTSFAYAGDPQSASGGTTTVTDPAGNVRVDGYVYGVRTYETVGYGTSDASTTTWQYDRSTLALIGQMDPNGNLTRYTVDSSGNVLTTTDALGRQTTNTYNSLNEPLTTQDPNGVTTTNTYDSHGNLLTTSTPLTNTSATATNCSSPSTAVAMARVTCYTYGDSAHPGDVTQVTDPDGKVSAFHYDAYGNRDQTKDPLGHVSGSQYNADGWLLNSWTPKAGCTWGSSPPAGCSSTYETQVSYVIPGGSATDEFGDVGTVTDPLGHTSKHTYDADRNVLTSVDGNGNATQYAYDAGDRRCWVLPGATSSNGCASPPTNARVTDYNVDDTVADQKDGKGDAILSYGYNHRGRVVSTTDALGNVTSYTLDADGNVLTKLDPVSGATCSGSKVGCTTYTYDGDNELKTVSYSDSSSENVTSISYDSDGQRTGMADGTGSSSWSFDSLHRLTGYTNGDGDTVSYGYNYGSGPAYDLKAQVRTITYPNSAGTVTQGWNDDGTLASVTDWNSQTTNFAYDANANETGQTVPSTTNVTDTYGYNAADQMTSVSDSNGSTLFSATYGRDSNGQLSSDSSQSTNQQNYRYTSLNQLCNAGPTGNTCSSTSPAYPYAFDNADNLTTNNGTAQQYNATDELCWTVSGSSTNGCGTAPTGATTYSYDNKGNMTHIGPASGAQTCNTYDQANLLTQVQTGTGSGCSTPTTVGTYAYDGDGIRESKTVAGTTTHFSWDGVGTHILQQKAGTTVTSFLYGPGGLPFEQISGSTATYLHHDQIGSTRLITDAAGSSGTATTFTFDPYGNQVTSTGSLTSPWMYTGAYLDSETGWYALVHRYYQPGIGQFMTVDPKVGSTRSPYAYVEGNPLNRVDPLGLDDWGADLANNGFGNTFAGYTNGTSVLNAANQWLGPNPNEIAPGVYRSTVNPSRQFRMTTADITGAHGDEGPHCHFESIGSNGRTIVENSHVTLVEGEAMQQEQAVQAEEEVQAELQAYQEEIQAEEQAVQEYLTALEEGEEG